MQRTVTFYSATSGHLIAVVIDGAFDALGILLCSTTARVICTTLKSPYRLAKLGIGHSVLRRRVLFRRTANISVFHVTQCPLGTDTPQGAQSPRRERSPRANPNAQS